MPWMPRRRVPCRESQLVLSQRWILKQFITTIKPPGSQLKWWWVSSGNPDLQNGRKIQVKGLCIYKRWPRKMREMSTKIPKNSYEEPIKFPIQVNLVFFCFGGIGFWSWFLKYMIFKMIPRMSITFFQPKLVTHKEGITQVGSPTLALVACLVVNKIRNKAIPLSMVQKSC